MEDQKDRGPYKMALEKTEDQVEEREFELDPTVDVVEDDGFDPQSAHEEWDAQEPDGFLKRYGTMLGFLAVGAAVIWLLVNWIGTTREMAHISGIQDTEIQLQQLASRIAQLEQHLQTEPSPQPNSSTQSGLEAVERVTKDDLDRLSSRIESLESMVNRLRTQGTGSSAKKPVTVAAKKKSPIPKKVATMKKPVKTSAPYTVKKGDTLYGVATQNKVTVDQLKLWNGLTGETLIVGQKLKVTP